MRRLNEFRAEGLLCDAALTAPGCSDLQPQVAHQVVLAACSAPLRDFLVHEAQAAASPAAVQAGLPSPPQLTELQLGGLAVPAFSLPAAMNALYAQGASTGKADGGTDEDFAKLSEAWGLSGFPSAPLSAAAVCAGLREQRYFGLLCDAVLIVGGARRPVHLAVLAAASEALRHRIVEALEELSVEAGGMRRGSRTLSERPLELSLPDVTQPETVGILLDCLYGMEPLELPEADQQDKFNRELRRLASSLDLPALAALAQPHAVSMGTAGGEPVPQVSLPLLDDGRSSRRISTASVGEKEGHTALPKTVTVRLSLRSCSFSATEVPDASAAWDEEALPKQDKRLLDRLRAAFVERPVWLEASLLKRLPSGVDDATFVRLLPFVAFQWTDGPWQKGYTRFGYDPREDAKVSISLQVIQFRDPHFKCPPKSAKEAEPEDPTFRRPPSSKIQLYQLADIQDDFIESFVASAEVLESCDKKTGWFPQLLWDIVRDRLCVKSQLLRERLAQRSAGSSAAVAKARARASVVGRGPSPKATASDKAPTAVGTRSAGSGSGSGRMSIVPSKRVVVDKAGDKRATKKARTVGGA